MRTAGFWGVAMVLALVGPVAAQQASQSNFPAEMAIAVPEIEVRSGPTKQYYPTSKLRMGDRVLVLRESKDQPGWLAIKPPPGSFSWIKGKNVKQVDGQNGYVLGEGNAGVPVLPGSSLIDRTPNVEAVKVPPGSLVVILDKPFQAEGETWLPIQPPPTEVRFIPAEAVRLSAPTVAVSPSGFPTQVGGNNLIAQADQAYQAGKVEMAKQLYRQAADQAPNQEQRAFALNRLASLSLTTGTPAWQPGAQPNNLLHTTGQTTSMYAFGSGNAVTQPAQWSTWGYLRKASFEKDGQPVFVLENRQGQPLIYAVAQSGTSLREYTGKMVCLYGPITYRGEDYPRIQYMVASHVALP